MLQFNDTSTYNGIIQHTERECGFNLGDISGDPTKLALFTSDTNLGMDEVATIYAEVGCDWDYDDSNHTKYPIVTTNIVADQQDYTITEDSDGNAITEITKVMAKFASTDPYKELEQVNQQSGMDVDDFQNGLSGPSDRYDLIANGIFLEKKPTTGVDDGLLVFVGRTSSYFTVSDTTKEPGFDPRFHYYLVLCNAEKYARTHQLDSHQDLLQRKLIMRDRMQSVLRLKNRAGKQRMVPKVESTR